MRDGMSKQQAITESTSHSKAYVVDDTNPEYVVIKGVRVLNQSSRNGGIYESKAIQSAAALSNRLPLAIEHTSEQGRKYVERVGQLRDGRVIEGGKAVEADAWINRGDKLASKIVIDAKHFPENINLSVEMPSDGWIGEDTRRIDGKYRVKDITRMVDCSIVAEGGTTSTLYESYRPGNEDKDMSQTDVKEAVRNELQEAEARKAAIEERAKLDKEIETLRADNAKLQEQLDAMKAAEAKRTRIAAIVAQAKDIGAGEITEAYAETLSALSEAATKAIFEREASLAKGNAEQPTPKHVQAPSVGGVTEGNDKAWSWVDTLK